MIKLFLFTMIFASQSFAATTTEPPAKFSDAESNFRAVMQKLLDKYVDKNLSKDDLYRGATSGMLASLNSSNEKAWNKLLSPSEFREMQLDLSGKLSGIGAEMKWDDPHGYAQILRIMTKSPAEKAGLKSDDVVLSVNGQKFKGKTLSDMVSVIRGEAGKSVSLKILRDDKILDISVRREVITWTPVSLQDVGNHTALLAIEYFTVDTPKLVEQKLQEFKDKHFEKLIVDLRDSSGGGLNEAIETAGYFIPSGAVIVKTKTREGKMEEAKSTQSLIDKKVHIVALTNKGTYCGAELFVAALKDNDNIKVVGETTSGKWNVQSIEQLPNQYAIKYTVSEFQSPLGHSYQDKGMKPDLEVLLPHEPTSLELADMRSHMTIEKRLAVDAQLKAALELIQSI